MSPLSMTHRLSRRVTVLACAAVAVVGSTVAVAATSSAAPQPSGGGHRDLETRNTAVVRDAYAQFFGQGRTDSYSRYFADGLIQHDPAIAAGRAGLVTSVRARYDAVPRPVVTIKHLLADGEFVAVHSQVSTSPTNEASGRAMIDLYRLASDRIVEHWAVTQDVPATTASGNSMFSDLYRYPTTPPPATPAVRDSNKQLILKAWAAVYSAKDTTVLDRYWAGPDYLQHNPRVPNGTAGLKGFLGTLPPSVSQNRFALASGDLVLTFNQSVATSADLTSDYTGTAVVDLYRVVGSVVVEHWDVLQPVPATSANGNSMFSELYQER